MTELAEDGGPPGVLVFAEDGATAVAELAADEGCPGGRRGWFPGGLLGPMPLEALRCRPSIPVYSYQTVPAIVLCYGPTIPPR